MSDKYPQRAICEECQYEWIVCWLPMLAHLVAKMFTTMRCPMCGIGAGSLRLLPTQRPQATQTVIRSHEVHE